MFSTAAFSDSAPWTLPLFNPDQIERINRSRLKRAVDCLGALVGLLVLLPLVMLPIAVAIKLDSRGPVLYRQLRNGRGGQFHILKFRSMTFEASAGAFQQATQVDPRITRVGRILRRYNLDELPQLWNVLVGDMSLVGPRPHPLPLDASFEGSLAALPMRYLVRPGITGWAQVNGLRGETSRIETMADRLHHDLEYIANWSILLDLRIVWQTLWFRRAYANAY